MTSVMFSKWAGDWLTHPLYHALLEVKCIPFLEQEPSATTDEGKKINLEISTAEEVMSQPAVCVNVVEEVLIPENIRIHVNVLTTHCIPG